MNFPVQIINKPVAKGSKVPAWPIFIFFKEYLSLISPLIFFTTSKDDQFIGLLIKIIFPFKKSSAVIKKILINKMNTK